MRILVYSGIMGRKSKYNEKVSGHLVDLIKSGLSFKQACLRVGISEDSFARWRKANPTFDKQIKKAKNQKKLSTKNGEKDQKGIESHLKTEKPLETPLNASGSLPEESETYMGLPVYHELSDDIPSNKPFYYPSENAIQFFDYRRIRYSCPTDLWSRKHSMSLYGDEWTETF